MSRWMAAAMLIVVLLPAPLRAGEPRYEFSHDKTRYRFEGSFRTQGKPACLLGMLFEFNHLKQYVSHAESVTLNAIGENWQEVTYQYRNPFYKASSTFRRTLHSAQNRVEYRLIHLEEGGLIRPHIQDISGYYGVIEEKGTRRVTFFQEGELEGGILTGFYFGHARDVAIGFLKEIARYADRHCP